MTIFVGGTEDTDLLKGLGGSDFLVGIGGDDTHDGGTADDFLAGGFDGDRSIGGNGNDTVTFASAEFGPRSDGPVTVSLIQGFGSGGPAEGDTYQGIVNIDGSAFTGDLLIGDNGVNIICSPPANWIVRNWSFPSRFLSGDRSGIA